MSSQKPVIVWFRQDLRLSDNPALSQAVESGAPVIPVYVLDEETPRTESGDWRLGGAQRWWLHHSLERLEESLRDKGAGLVLRSGPADEVIPALVQETQSQAVFWNRCYEPFAVTRDRAIKSALDEAGVAVHSFGANLIHEPWTLQTKAGEPFKVFTPFYKAALAKGEPAEPLSPPKRIAAATLPQGDRLSDWDLLPQKPDWAGGLRDTWTPGETGARGRLAGFIGNTLGHYKKDRNRPDLPHSSRLSPHLHWGEVSPRQIWHSVRRHQHESGGGKIDSAAEAFLREVIWREFSYNLLFHWPELPARNWKPEFDDFPWRDDAKALRAWQRGQTGFPIVDAAMRELYATGWMHNRSRMIVASFLTKDLLIHWREGEAWFWDTLVDADLANNSASWQWTAGSGADAAPYFRIFNPVSQGERFDPEGAYVRQWVPELRGLPDGYIHKPWDAPADVLERAGVRLGKDYPERLVDHKQARRRALDAYETIKKDKAA
ncbi:MAG: deoxyribodipyrimidine photo-lyase [Rhodovibrionaceae bacterium]|nr:deoxyribodipyrimidine photo-lyase [Rhodovibrionaceae bacterium]